MSQLKAIDLEVRDNLNLPSSAKQTVVAAALAKHSGAPEKVEFYKVSNRTDICFTLLKFKRETKATEATDFYYHATMRLTDGSILKEDTFSNFLRIFPLKSTTLILRLDDETSYDPLLALFQKLENGEVDSLKPTRIRAGNIITVHSSPVSNGILQAADLPKIVNAQYDTKRKQFLLTTRTGEGNGAFYQFTHENGVFLCVSSGTAWF